MDPIKIIFFADTHLGFDYPVRPRVDRKRRGQDFFNNFQNVLNYAVDSKADLIIHGGDFFFRSRIPPKIINIAYDILLKFADKNIPIFIVPGNHERSNLPLALQLNHPNINIFHAPKTFVLELKGTKILLAGFPCQRNNIRDRFFPRLKATNYLTNKGDIKLLCLHQSVEGAQILNYTFRHGKDVIRMADLPLDFHAVLTGHIHRKQVLLKQGNGHSMPVIYPGSIERTSFSEKAEEKGFFEILFGRSHGKKQEIQNLNFIKLPTRPMEDLFLENLVNVSNLTSYIYAKIAKFSKDAIIRIKCNNGLDEEVKKMITPSYLRENFPDRLNFQLSSDFYPPRPEKKN